MLKRVLSWLLVFAMVCSMLPVNAMAVSVGSDQKPTVIQTETVTMINPLYADLITLEDLALPEPEPAADSGEVAADAYAATYGKPPRSFGKV